MKTLVLPRRKYTGKNMVLLNAFFRHRQLFKASHKSSIRLAHFNDYISQPEKYLKAFIEADGIYFEGLNIAVINMDKKDEISFFNREQKKAVMTTEPERYVYKIDRQDYLKGYHDGINALMNNLRQYDGQANSGFNNYYTDNEKASWGIHATGIADSLFSGKGINIAVLDTGLYKEHIDLKGRKIVTKKFVSTGIAGDVDGHGSHCAGIACGNTDEKGMRYGVAGQSNIYCGKVLDDNGEGTDSGILAGIEWAITRKCRVISMSLGAPAERGEPFSETYENAAIRAMQQGALIVAAAGNESNRPTMVAPVGHPANCPSIMAVGAVDNYLNMAYFSCGGINPNGGQVDIVAPGVSVYSMINEDNAHDRWDGTSMATPFVAGIAALYYEQNPQSAPLDVWSYLTQHAKRLPLSSADAGSGLVQAPKP